MNRLKSNHQDLELNTIIYWQPMAVFMLETLKSSRDDFNV